MKKYLIGFAIVLLAFFFRFNNLNWDVNSHLHPDERFLTMVGQAMKIPTSINQYFDQKTSLMNPVNVGYGFFVYGRFPLILTKYLAVIYNLDNYNAFTILGRQLSAFFDLLIIFFIVKTVGLLEKKLKLSSSIKYWAGFFYAIAVLPIQLSHFFAVDTFLNFFMFGSFYFALLYSTKVGKTRLLRCILLSALFFGFALACKVTALFILPLNLFFILGSVFNKRQSFKKIFYYLIIYLLVSYFALRFADPYYFQNHNLFDPTLSKLFIENIKSLKNMTVKSMDNWFPPMVQWLNKNTVQHSLVNNIIFGLGIPQAILTIFGTCLIIIPNNFKFLISKQFLIFNKFLNKKSKANHRTIKQWNNLDIVIILFWVLSVFIYESLQTTPTLRYFIFIYPFLAIFAALGMNYLIDFKIRLKGKYISYPKIFSYIFIFFSVLILLLWPVMFSSVYFYKHTRVEASEWIYKNLANNSVILGEYWDDPLPLSIINNYDKQFTIEQLPVFDPDTQKKWQKMNMMLDNAEYYILSSNRGWGSIISVPEKYPSMSKFYKELLSDRNFKYKKIKEFTSYPKFSIFNFQFSMPDQWSDEGFTVYDHPQVLIFKNERYSSKTF
jgi:hypothetical protein